MSELDKHVFLKTIHELDYADGTYFVEGKPEQVITKDIDLANALFCLDYVNLTGPTVDHFIAMGYCNTDREFYPDEQKNLIELWLQEN